MPHREKAKHDLKSILAENGIPETLISDNGLQYSSQEFAAFCKQWGIDHVTSSPLYPQSNGFVERSVQTVKNLLGKAEASGQDPYLALLTYRTTPVDSILPSPSLAAEPQSLPHTTAVQWPPTTFTRDKPQRATTKSTEHPEKPVRPPVDT